MQPFRAHGKLLLTAEYAITQGAEGLAVPTVYGQTLMVDEGSGAPGIFWVAKSVEGTTWFEAQFDEHLEVVSSTAASIARHLQGMLRAGQSFSSRPLPSGVWTTSLDYPQQWGLGSSSTLASLIAQAAGIPGQRMREIHKGSGYDIACATANGPLLYRLDQGVAQAAPTPLH